MDQIRRDFGHLGGSGGAHPSSVGVEGILGETVRVEIHQRSQHRRRGLETEGKASRGEGFRIGELAPGGRLHPDTLELGQDEIHHSARLGKAGKGRHQEGPGGAPQGEVGVHPIGEALLGPDAPHQAR